MDDVLILKKLNNFSILFFWTIEKQWKSNLFYKWSEYYHEILRSKFSQQIFSWFMTQAIRKRILCSRLSGSVWKVFPVILNMCSQYVLKPFKIHSSSNSCAVVVQRESMKKRKIFCFIIQKKSTRSRHEITNFQENYQHHNGKFIAPSFWS